MLTLMSLLSGSSDSSADLQSEDAQRMADAIGQSPKAQELLRLDEENPTLSDAEAADALQALRTLEDEAGKAIDAYLELREFRVSEGLDPCAPCLFELPLVLWRGVRHAALHANNEQTNDTNEEDVLAQCLKKIPEAHHETFHALLAEARLTFGIRDERALYSDIWAWGIMRTVFLEIGRRLATRTPPRIIETSDILQATTTEVKAMFLHDASEPSAQTLQERARFQQSYEVSVAPTSLGPPPYPPPPPDLLSGGARRLAEAFGATFQLILAPAPPPPKEGSMEFVGRPASGGDYVGTVHVVNSTHDASSLKKDAVLVVGAGSSSFTMLAPLASAVIAEGGGLLSHVAIVCREYRIPCVCGCTGVLSRLKNGDRVRVDGTRGIVSLLDPPAT